MVSALADLVQSLDMAHCKDARLPPERDRLLRLQRHALRHPACPGAGGPGRGRPMVHRHPLAAERLQPALRGAQPLHVRGAADSRGLERRLPRVHVQQDLPAGGDRLQPPHGQAPLQAQGFNVLTLLTACKTNYLDSKWDQAAYRRPTRTSRSRPRSKRWGRACPARRRAPLAWSSSSTSPGSSRRCTRTCSPLRPRPTSTPARSSLGPPRSPSSRPPSRRPSRPASTSTRLHLPATVQPVDAAVRQRVPVAQRRTVTLQGRAGHRRGGARRPSSLLPPPWPPCRATSKRRAGGLLQPGGRHHAPDDGLHPLLQGQLLARGQPREAVRARVVRDLNGSTLALDPSDCFQETNQTPPYSCGSAARQLVHQILLPAGDRQELADHHR